jgi:hypothetical protein
MNAITSLIISATSTPVFNAYILGLNITKLGLLGDTVPVGNISIGYINYIYY